MSTPDSHRGTLPGREVDPDLDPDAVALVAELTARGETVATAESLTAGLVAAVLAGVPGASAVLVGGLITYTVETKVALAGVAPELLARHGPVAAPTAAALADGARTRCGATWGVSLTGVAGPSAHGGHDVGTVFVGVAGPDGTETSRLALPGSRWDIRRAATTQALVSLRRRLAAIG